MSTPLLKDLYTPQFLNAFAQLVHQEYPAFNPNHFVKQVMNSEWPDLELKQRQKHMARVWEDQLSGSFEKKSDLVVQVVKRIQQQGPKAMSIEWMFIPEFYELFGRAYPQVAIPALTEVTQLTSCEFAVRPYILDAPQKMMEHMLEWAHHPHPLVRRLASEGSRPRLPWAMALPFLKKDPSPALPILHVLKNDSAETVRRSVANHVNDIAKDHPDVVIQLLDAWKNISPEVDWVRKHAARTLLKKANPDVLTRFGLTPPTSIQSQLHLNQQQIAWQGTLPFEIKFMHQEPEDQLLRIEFAIDYVKSNGRQNRKIFKVTERHYPPNQWFSYPRNHAFIERTTRKHYPGTHGIALIINGKEVNAASFELQKPIM